MAQEQSHTDGNSGATEKAPLSSFRRYAKVTLVFLVVAWHLFFFAVRNPLDLWDDAITSWLRRAGWFYRDSDTVPEHAWNVRPGYRFFDELTFRYANTVGVEQRWVMFTPPMAQRAPFLAVRFEFDDDSTELVKSANEPTPHQFFRFGDWQNRKYEDAIMEIPDRKGDDNPEWPMWVQFVRRVVARWKAKHPDDTRRMVRVVLVKRFIDFPNPDQPSDQYTYDTEDLVTFDPEGKLL